MTEENPIELEAAIETADIKETHSSDIARMITKDFGQEPKSISRMGSGICNEVYLVTLDNKEVIARLNKEERFLLGSHNHIPLFKSKGIVVPDILAEDYSKQIIPYAYQVLSKLEGQDIDKVIYTLTDEQLKTVAKEISNVFQQLKDVPTNGKYGVVWGDERELVSSWGESIRHMSNVVIGWGEKTGVIDDFLRTVLEELNEKYKDYFDSVKSVLYFGDMSSKNVMIHNGQFSGLVDLDSLAQGDHLETIGRIKASWYGSHHGAVYTEAVMDAEGLDAEQRKIVTMYALLNRTYWTMENGVQFNQNTKAVVNLDADKENKQKVKQLYDELQRA